MAQVFKSPLAQSQAWQVPKYNKAALVAYLKNYGSGFTDDAYEEWAKKKGKPLQSKPLNKDFIGTPYHRQYYGDKTTTYADQYLNDDEWLQEAWPSYSEDATDYYETIKPQKVERDEDYERSWGEDSDKYYNEEFFKQAKGDRNAFIEHNINRFGIPRGSNRNKEVEHYGQVFDRLNKGGK